MSYRRFLVALSLACISVSATDAEARKNNIRAWHTYVVSGQDFQPYLNGQTINQTAQWDMAAWTPQAWIDSVGGDADAIIRDFYAAGIMVDQYKTKKNIPALRVGDAFMQLSGGDRRKVLMLIDHIYGVTASEEFGMFYVYFDRYDREPVGLYNTQGFQSY